MSLIFSYKRKLKFDIKNIMNNDADLLKVYKPHLDENSLNSVDLEKNNNLRSWNMQWWKNTIYISQTSLTKSNIIISLG